MSLQAEYEVDQSDGVIDKVRKSLAQRFFVEFLQQGGPKPHVVIRLDIEPIELEEKTCEGCRLTMDLEGDCDGVFHIVPLYYSGTSLAAHAAFEFRIKREDWKVEDYINSIRHLLLFSFQGGFRQPGSKIEYVDGCRDWITQFFIGLHRRGVVGWHVSQIARGIFNGTNPHIVAGKTGFHEVIGYNYKDSGGSNTLAETLPLARGTFWTGNFQRTVSYKVDNKHTYQLPYDPANPQEGDEGNEGATHNTGKGKAKDYSKGYFPTMWSEWEWDQEKNCYARYRLSAPEVYEWDYNHPKQEGRVPTDEGIEGASQSQILGTGKGKATDYSKGYFPTMWSEWEWDQDRNCYARYRLSAPEVYEWDYN